MKKKIILATAFSLTLGISAATFAYQQMSVTPTTVSCETKGDCCCCKGDSCPMKKNGAPSEKDSCCSCCKDKTGESMD